MSTQTKSDLDKQETWVLTDYRVGNSLQAIALAKKLNISYDIKHIEYNMLSSLPNFLLINTLLFIKEKSRAELTAASRPKIIISAGRRTANIAVYFKKHYPDIKIIQIMRPGEISTKFFDYIILPQHDVYNNTGSNIIRTIGSLNDVMDRISAAQDNFLQNYPTMQKFIGVVIGGNSKEYNFSREHAQELCSTLENLSAKQGLPIMVSFSRRTPEHVKTIFTEHFAWPHAIYDPTIDLNVENPYIGILRHCTYLVITADSISMCSEAASSGKPFYIYYPNSFSSRKHKYFTQQLIDLRMACRLTPNLEALESYSYQPLNELDKVAKIISQSL